MNEEVEMTEQTIAAVAAGAIFLGGAFTGIGIGLILSWRITLSVLKEVFALGAKEPNKEEEGTITTEEPVPTQRTLFDVSQDDS